MAQPTLESRFSSVYEALPEEAKRELLENHVLPSLDRLPPVDYVRLANAVEDTHSRFVKMPKLDLPAKTAEVDALFNELRRDVSCSATSSLRGEIYEQLIDSFVSWLSDIWQVAVEYCVEFKLAHECLLFNSRMLSQLHTVSAGHDYWSVDMYIPIFIKDSRGNPVKHFSCSGPKLLADVFLWIWRDILMRILSLKKPRLIALIPHILKDIQAMYGDWTPLERLSVIGEKMQFDEDTDSEEEGKDKNDLQCPKRATHWSSFLVSNLPLLHAKIASALYNTFKLTPSPHIYTAIATLAPDMRPQLLAHLREAATYSAATAVAALDISMAAKDADAVVSILDAARYVFRPRDASAMQDAVRMISRTPHAPIALAIITRELQDCTQVMRAHIASIGAFGGLDSDSSQKELADILRMQQGTHQRKERVEHWADEALIPTTSDWGHMMFTDLLPGIEDSDDFNPFRSAGITENDPEYQELLDEWRPCLNHRFESWVQIAKIFDDDGEELLTHIAQIVAEAMPYTLGADIVSEMMDRIQNSAWRRHIYDALHALDIFMVSQRGKALHGMTMPDEQTSGTIPED